MQERSTEDWNAAYWEEKTHGWTWDQVKDGMKRDQAETDERWVEKESAYRYGVGAHLQYGAAFTTWNDALEQKLALEWNEDRTGKTFKVIRDAVHAGWDAKKAGYVQDLESQVLDNTDFRRVLYTAKFSQLVAMSLMPKEELGAERHPVDQFFRFESGAGDVVVDGVTSAVRDGVAVLVPANSLHNVINTGVEHLKFYTVYSPPNHRDGVVHHTRADAEAAREHFDGTTTEPR
jgi:mannose-6-phosphate isomerase-like protein (cupin superfamily)